MTKVQFGFLLSNWLNMWLVSFWFLIGRVWTPVASPLINQSSCFHLSEASQC